MPESGTRGPRAARLGLALGLLLAAAAPALSQEAPPTVYEFDTPLAPVCVDGSYPLDFLVQGFWIRGTLVATTDSRGRLAGTWTETALGRVLEAKGRVKYREGLNEITLTLKDAAARLRLKGVLEAAGFSGISKGKGDLAAGESDFLLLTGTMEPSVASVAVVLPPDTGGKLTGTGTVEVCGDPVAVKGVRTVRKSLRLTIKGGGFLWAGSGPPGAEPGSSTVAYTVRGWGAKVAGIGMPLAVLDPPSGLAYADPAPLYEEEEEAIPNVPAVGGGAVKTWSVSPPLPAGLALDPATGVLSGTPEDPAPTSIHTVTASNLAGAATAPLDVTVRLNHAYSWAPESRALTDDDLKFFLARTHFGVRQDELAALQAAGLDAFLDDMLVMQSGTAIEAAAFPELVNATDPPGLQGGFPNGYQMSRWWERIMRDTDRPFQEVMAFFWHDHMPISYGVLGGGFTHFFVDYANLLRHEATGNLRNLLLAMARDQGMLVYLDGYANNRFAPNENFAREFWELFSLGVDNGYTQADIQEAARAFTGYQFRYDAATGRYFLAFTPFLHDAGSKTFFGATISGQNVGDDYAAVVDITLANRPVDRFLTRKIFEHFAYTNPPDSLVNAMAADLRGSGWELKPFLRNLFKSEAFFSKRAREGRAKSPVEYTIGLMRTTHLKLRVDYVDYFQTLLGQRPGDPPTVNGWPLGSLWFSAAAMVNRTNTAWYTVNILSAPVAEGENVAVILPPPAERTAEAVVDTVSDLMRVALSDADAQELVDFLNSRRLNDGTIVASPFDGTNQQHLDERVRGLIYILAQHPLYQVK